MVIIFDIDSESDLKDIYYSIDSQDAVESTSDKITGLLRDRKYNGKSNIIKKGQFKRGLDLACLYGYNDKGEYLGKSSLEMKLDY